MFIYYCNNAFMNEALLLALRSYQIDASIEIGVSYRESQKITKF